MKRSEPPQPKRPLVSVERQWEKDIFTGREETRMFVKMYFEARDSGLLGHMPPELWQTLCALATYMDETGFAFPSQERLARDLSIGRQQVNSRLKRLAEYRFNGTPVISVHKMTGQRGEAGRWARNSYRIETIAGLGIFGDRRRPKVAVSCRGDTATVSGQPDTVSESAPADTGRAETAHNDSNKIQKRNQICRVDEPGIESVLAHRLVRHFQKNTSDGDSRRPTRRELAQARDLVVRLGEGRAHFLVDFALEEARKTRFEMRVFGAVLQYERESMMAHERAQKRLVKKAQEERERQLADLHFRYDRWRTSEAKRRMASERDETLEEVHAQAAEHLRTQGWRESNPVYATVVERFVTTEFARRYRLPDFEAWYANDYPALRRNGLA